MANQIFRTSGNIPDNDFLRWNMIFGNWVGVLEAPSFRLRAADTISIKRDPYSFVCKNLIMRVVSDKHSFSCDRWERRMSDILHMKIKGGRRQILFGRLEIQFFGWWLQKLHAPISAGGHAQIFLHNAVLDVHPCAGLKHKTKIISVWYRLKKLIIFRPEINIPWWWRPRENL